MSSVCLYFQVHQPFRLRSDFDFFSIGSDQFYEDADLNAGILRKVSDRCYLPTNALILDLIRRHQGQFRVSYSISGTALDQFEKYDPRVIESFKALAATGSVEFIGETYYHSLASLYSEDEFRTQIEMHRLKIHQLFGQYPTTFRNTELIYNDTIAKTAEHLGFRTILTEGVDRILGWRSPNYVYRPTGTQNIHLLLKNYRLSDDIAFRFSSQQWDEWPLTADKFASWMHQDGNCGDTVNLFMDYETFGEHQWACSGIFEFLKSLPSAVLNKSGFSFATPSEISAKCLPVADISVPDTISWADSERDVTAWLGNPLQNAAAQAVFSMESSVKSMRSDELVHEWRKLQTSDHFYYMCTKFWADGDVHKYFSPYDSPYSAFIYHANAINHLRSMCEEHISRRKGISKVKRIKAQSRIKRVRPSQNHVAAVAHGVNAVNS